MPNLKVYTNGDKDPISEPHDLVNLANHPRSSRILISGNPGSGKSNIVKNILCAQSPEYDKCYLFHICKKTKEYEDLGCEIVTTAEELPNLDDITPNEKMVIIFEDVDYSSLKKNDIILLDKYLRYGCTHLGLTCIICCQNFYSLPVSMRRKIDIYYITRMDTATMSIICRNFSITKKRFILLTDEYLSNPYDSLCFCDNGHPVKIRHNIFTPICNY
jgi:energy-coupling factor transporter ATP-binding protein EcfA2